jgi:hypothetical protein
MDPYPEGAFTVWIRLAALWLLLSLIHLLDWNLGFHRGLGLVLLLLFVLGSPATATIKRQASCVVLAILLAFGTAVFIYGLIHATPIDIGESGARATDAFVANLSNPYSTQVDEVNVTQSDHFFGGYKYFPLTLLLYAPGVLLFGIKGLYLTNYLFFLGTLGVVYGIAKHLHRNGAIADPAIPVIIYASSVTILLENFIGGVNDGVITFFGLAAVLALFRQREGLSALLLGCAIGTNGRSADCSR